MEEVNDLPRFGEQWSSVGASTGRIGRFWSRLVLSAEAHRWAGTTDPPASGPTTGGMTAGVAPPPRADPKDAADSHVDDSGSPRAESRTSAYLCRGSGVKGAVWVVTSSSAGGPWARSRALVVCARAPGLISVRGLAVRRAGDVMGDGVFRGMRCGRSVFGGRPRGRGGSAMRGAGRGASEWL